MENLKNKLVLDIRSVGEANFVASESEIDLSHSSSVPDQESPVKEENKNDNAEPQTSTEQRSDGIDGILNDIIAEPMSDKDVVEALMNGDYDPIIELVSIGAVMGKDMSKSIKGKVLSSKDRESDEFYHKIIAQIHAPVARVAVSLSSVKPIISAQSQSEAKAAQVGRIIFENQIADFYNKPNAVISSVVSPSRSLAVEKRAFNFAPPQKKNFSTHFFILLAVVGIVSYGFTLKNELVKEGSSALNNLEQAQTSLQNFDFNGAVTNFQKSYDDFTKAGQNLNLVGAGLADIFSSVPGLGKLKSAKDMVEIGKLLSQSGQAMSQAVVTLSKTGAILDPNSKNKQKPSQIINQLRSAIELSSRNFTKAKALISDIDESVIPEDKQETFHDFKDKMPIFEQLLADSEGYIDFLEGIIGIDQHKKYLLLFQNNSELRPVGGFPGTYGVISFSNGGLENFFVNDVYNLDGQLKESIIPPKQLQHITPTLGMRDSAWFIDFPISAKKAMEYFTKEAGYQVDGVITLNPDIISGILNIIGPIKMSDYDVNLTADNFLESIQQEVEYGPNRVQPKQVVVDFAPRLLEKLYSSSPEKWAKIFNIFMAGLDQKDILFYFDDKNLENFAVEKGFGGEVKNFPTVSGQSSDYLMIDFSNVKGSKTDIVTDSSVTVDSHIGSGDIIHKVTILRDHNGGDYDHGFYNKQNPAYVRVLLPKNAQLIDVNGNDFPNFKPLITYNSSFSKDKDIEKLESNSYFDKNLGVDVYEESGKKEIGFWMITDPGKSKKIEFEYSVPISGSNYSFYFQKQPGLDWKNFKLIFRNAGSDVVSASSMLNKVGDTYILDKELKEDIEVSLKLK